MVFFSAEICKLEVFVFYNKYLKLRDKIKFINPKTKQRQCKNHVKKVNCKKKPGKYLHYVECFKDLFQGVSQLCVIILVFKTKNFKAITFLETFILKYE